MLIEGINFLEILFELTIFFLLSVFVYKIVKNYVLPLLYGEIETIKEKEEDIKDKDKLLVSSKRRLEKEIEFQNEKFFLLEKKVQLWNQDLVNKNKKDEELSKFIVKQVKEKRKKQEVNLSLFKMQKIVIPEAIKLAYKEIEKSYSGKKGESLFKELILKTEPRSGNI